MICSLLLLQRWEGLVCHAHWSWLSDLAFLKPHLSHSNSTNSAALRAAILHVWLDILACQAVSQTFEHDKIAIIKTLISTYGLLQRNYKIFPQGAVPYLEIQILWSSETSEISLIQWNLNTITCSRHLICLNFKQKAPFIVNSILQMCILTLSDGVVLIMKVNVKKIFWCVLMWSLSPDEDHEMWSHGLHHQFYGKI